MIPVSATAESQATSVKATATISSSASSSSTSQPSQAPTSYIIFPKEAVANDATQRAALEAFLKPFAQPGTFEILAELYGFKVVIYVLVTTEENASKIASDKRIDLVELNTDASKDFPKSSNPPSSPPPSVVQEDFGDVIVDKAAQSFLRMMSMPPGLSDLGAKLDEMPGYAYPKEAGEGVTVYLIDSGANPDHDEFKNAKGTKRWIFPTNEKRETDEQGHGSCVQSLINGPAFGTAKKADLVVVKVGEIPRLSVVLSSLLLIHNDVVEKKLQGKAVINLSYGIQLLVLKSNTAGVQPGFKDPDTIDAFETVLKLLIAEDVVLVTTSGNQRDQPNGGEFVTGFPGYFGRDIDIITVGAVDEAGKQTEYSQGVPRELDTSAIGRTLCAYNVGNKDAINEGTSMAAPLVSGMVAVFLSQAEYRERLQVPGKVAANVKQLVRELSYNRGGGGDRAVAWNGLDVFSCGTASRSLRARGESCAINATTSTFTTLTSTAPPAKITTTALVSTSTHAKPSVEPVPCYNFNDKAYGYCCPDADNPCEHDLGKCYLPFTGEGVGGGDNGIVPTGARCPPPEGAQICTGACNQ
ncbi:subtilase [Colletotrichum truncatum]|uniref:Subtilase n=1 Tax=Colletotrichum truncatum TaxID=5467 RepID=A0ACC3YY80_COLTU|nr:subtilase [Colletotrichum truncatum]KAF6790900.1 subtilase [Colletotrichum truncatum]